MVFGWWCNNTGREDIYLFPQQLLNTHPTWVHRGCYFVLAKGKNHPSVCILRRIAAYGVRTKTFHMWASALLPACCLLCNLYKPTSLFSIWVRQSYLDVWHYQLEARPTGIFAVSSVTHLRLNISYYSSHIQHVPLFTVSCAMPLTEESHQNLLFFGF